MAPKSSDAWRRAAEEIPLEERPALHLVPSLDVFTSVENVLQLKRFVYTWARIRPRWLLKVGEELQPPDFSTRRAWRTFMRGSFDPTPAKPESEAGKSRLRFSAYLALPEPPSFDISKTSLGLGAPGPLDRTVSAEVVATVLRQVNQLNFFHDVFEVELKRTWDLPPVILERLEPITGSSTYFAHPDLMDLKTIDRRANWLLAFRGVLSFWPSTASKPLNFDLVPRKTERGFNVSDVVALELALARFYCHTAEEILGRRPTIPLYK